MSEHPTPIPMRLPCPACGELHVDEGEFAAKPHHTHACQHCGMVWRPAIVPTVGVLSLPGFRDPAAAERGEAMGLTPEPAPLVVTCNGRSIELSDKQVQAFINTSLPAAYGTATREIGNLLRDARQDPQPASDPEPPTPCDECETTGRNCIAHRSPSESAVEPDTSDTLDFDAMPVGTVLKDREGDYWVKLPDRWITLADDNVTSPDNFFAPYTVVYQPAPVSPHEGLRAVLAGRDDADELIAHAAASWYDHPGPRPNWWQVLRGAVGDAARSGGAT